MANLRRATKVQRELLYPVKGFKAVYNITKGCLIFGGQYREKIETWKLSQFFKVQLICRRIRSSLSVHFSSGILVHEKDDN